MVLYSHNGNLNSIMCKGDEEGTAKDVQLKDVQNIWGTVGKAGGPIKFRVESDALPPLNQCTLCLSVLLI